MKLRLGQVLAESGVLTEEQIASVLERQHDEQRPFGLLCEEMFGIDPSVIEDAWARQYTTLTRTIDPATEPFDETVRDMITRRQAWQFRILPLRYDGDEVMVATTSAHLRRALRFASNTFNVPVYFVMADTHALGEALCRHYPLPGLTADAVNDGGMEHLLGSLNGNP